MGVVEQLQKYTKMIRRLRCNAVIIRHTEDFDLLMSVSFAL